jgi:hypothetical protein
MGVYRLWKARSFFTCSPAAIRVDPTNHSYGYIRTFIESSSGRVPTERPCLSNIIEHRTSTAGHALPRANALVNMARP